MEEKENKSLYITKENLKEQFYSFLHPLAYAGIMMVFLVPFWKFAGKVNSDNEAIMKRYNDASNKVIVKYADTNEDGMFSEIEKSNLFSKIINENNAVIDEEAFIVRDKYGDAFGYKIQKVRDKSKNMVNHVTLTKWLNDYDAKISGGRK